VTGGSFGRHVPSGHLVYVRGSTLFAAPLDVKRLTVTGSEVPVIEGVSSLSSVGFADYAFADSGLLLYVAGGQQQITTTLEWADRKGARRPLNAPAQSFNFGLRFSPDGSRVGFVISGADIVKRNIWIYELARRTLTPLTSEGSNVSPVWTPDGQRVTYRSLRAGKNGIYSVAADGSGKPELLLASGSMANPSSWTPDGKALLYSQIDSGKWHIWVLPIPEGGGEARPREFVRTAFNELNAEISPDGKWVAYQSDESGQFQVYVRPFPGPGGKVQVSTQPSAIMPRWSGNGRELFYREGNGQLWVVDVQTGTSFRAGQPQALFKHGGLYDVTHDGKRFLLVKNQEAARSNARLEAVTDWFEDLRRRAPIKK